MGPAAWKLGPRPVSGNGTVAAAVPAGLIALAAAGWWWSMRVADGMAGSAGAMHGMGDQLSLGAFVLAWAAMMGAMMLPAVLPVVRLYARAAGADRAAPAPFFVGGYLVLWVAIGLPVYLAWRALEMPVAEGEAWVGRLAGAVLVAAAVWQVTPLKRACLRHCRSPLGFFLRYGRRIGRPMGALRMGAAHGAFCFGCCWALFAVLVVLGTMNLILMAGMALLIALEKNAPRGKAIAFAAAIVLAIAGVTLIAAPSTIVHLT